MAILTVNGADVPAPTTLSVYMEDAGGATQRAINGELLVSRTAVKRRMEAYWAYVAPDQLRTLLENALQSTPVVVSYPDPVTGQDRQMHAHCTLRRMDMKRLQGASPVWTGVQMTFTEC